MSTNCSSAASRLWTARNFRVGARARGGAPRRSCAAVATFWSRSRTIARKAKPALRRNCRRRRAAKKPRRTEMGRKINPTGFRLAVRRDWKSRWFAKGREFAQMVVEDAEISGDDRNRPRLGVDQPHRNRAHLQIGASDDSQRPPGDDYRQKRRGHRSPARPLARPKWASPICRWMSPKCASPN